MRDPRCLPMAPIATPPSSAAPPGAPRPLRGRARRIIAGVLFGLVSAALLSPAPAQAQTVTRDVWTATLTVDNDNNHASLGCADGRSEDGFDACSTALSDNDFVYNGTTYRITEFVYVAFLKQLDVAFTQQNVRTNLRSLTLHTDTATYFVSLAGPSGNVFPERMRWENVNLSWSPDDTVAVKFTEPLPKPAKPVGFMATAGAGRVALSWTDPSDATITKYQYRQKVGSAAWGAWTDIPSSAPGETNATSFTVTGLASGTEHRFRIRAVNAAGNGAPSDIAGPVTPTAADTTRPTVVAGSTGYYSSATLATALSGTQSARTNIYTKVTFSEDMKQVASNAATARPQLYYRIGTTDTQYDILAPGGTLASGDCKPNHATETDEYVCLYTVGDSDSGAFTVKAGTSSVDKANNALAAAYTHATSLTLAALSAPAKPTGLTAQAGNAQVALTWTNPNDATITKYQYRQKAGSSAWESAWTDIASSAPGETNATSFTVASLMNGTAYRFRIRTVNAAGNSVQSAVAGPVTPAVPTVEVPDVTAIAMGSSPPSSPGGWYKWNSVIKVELTFDEIITVTGSPALEITVGSAAKPASCARKGDTGDNRKVLVCSYTVYDGDEDTNGVSVAANKLTLPSNATIKDSDSNDATRTHSALPAQSGHKVDAKAPTLTVGAPTPTGPAKSKSITVTAADTGVGLQSSDNRYWFEDAGTTCDPNSLASNRADLITFAFGTPVVINSESRNGEYICFKTEDGLENHSYAKSAQITGIDTTNPGIGFPSGVTPKVGTASTITLTDSCSKVAKYGAIVVPGAKTNANDCNTAAKVGNTNLTTVTPASPVNFSYTPPADSATKKVCAYVEDAAGNSHASLWGTAIAAAATPPAASTGLTATKDGANAIDLSWTAPATASTRAAVTGYEIEWSADGSSGWTDLTTISTASTTTYKNSGLAASTTRHYRVRATSSAGAGTWSSTASATTDASGITIEFPSTGPRTGGTYTITLKDPTSKIAWYGAIAVPGTETDASVCDHSNKILRRHGYDGTVSLTRVSPPRAEVSFDYPTPLELAGMKACVYAYNGARVSHSRLSPVIPIPPRITDIAITSEAGSDRIYTRGETAEITFTFSKTVTVTQGSQPPRIRLSLAQSTTWWWADYVSGSGTTKLVFSHTLTVENGNPLNVSANSGQFFELRGGTIRDSDGNDADLDHEGLVYSLVSVFKTTPVPEGVKLTWEDPKDGTVTGWEYRQRLQGVVGPWTPIPGGADTRAHTVTGLGAGSIYNFQMRPVRGAAKGELMIGSQGRSWQLALPLAAPPPAGLTVPWDWAHLPVGPDGGPRFKDGDSFRLLFVTVGDRDAASPNIGEYNRFVQAEAPVAGSRALISTEGVEARDNTATTGTGSVPIWWLGGDKVADDYADFWDGSWDSQAGRSAHGDERSSAMVWTGSISNGRYALGKAAGEAQVQWGWLARAGKAVSFGYRGAQVRLSLYGLTPVITVKGVQPAPGPKAIGVRQGQAADSLAVSWKDVEVEGFTCDYRVEWKESCTGEEARCAWSAERRITVPGLGPNEATIGELTQGTSYDVRVRRSGGSRYAPWFPVGEKTFALPAAQQAPAVTAPVLESARVNGAELALRFDAVLDESSAPAGSAFAVSVAGAARTVSAVSVSAETATLTLASAAASGEAVTVGYTPPSTGKLRRAGGGDVAAFSGQAVTNDTPAPQPQLKAALPALTASVSSAPSEHRGTGLFVVRIAFSEAVTAKAKDAGVQVSGGTLSRAVRVKKRKDLWELRIEPAGNGAVTVTLPATTDCAAAGAICTADGRKLETALTHTVPGPVALSVADARAKEGEDATIDFAVTLSRAASGEVTVRYVTKNGSAKAGRDYTKAKGRLTFAAGETAKTVSVALLDDAKDEGEETFRLVLKSATGAIIADGEATGTIENDDPMPAAWLARFGRTVAGQAVDAVTARLEGGGGSHLTLGGQQVSLDSPQGQAQAAAELEAVAAALGAGTPGGGFDRGGWMRGGDRDERAGSSSYTMTGRELLLGSAFHLQSGGEAGGPGFAAWGRVAHGSFDGAEDGVTMDGEVTTGFLGADVAGERWLAGAAVARSQGEGTFALSGSTAGESAFDRGEIESTLTSVLPYARIDLSERVTAWGMLGYGTGELTLTETGEVESERHTADLTMTLGALGGRGTLVPAPEGGGFALALRTDAFWVRTESDATEGLAAAKGDATRLRLILDASRPFALGAGTLTPSLEAGLRHDGGDAETGTGIELGAGLAWTDPASGVSAELRARWLAAHEASGYEEWGVSGSVRVDPGERGRGLSLSLAPTVGNAGSGTGNLWSAADARGLAPGGEFEAARGLDAEVGYGMALFGDRFTGTPNLGAALSDGARAYRLSWRLTSAVPGDPGFEIGLDATRTESANDNAPEHGVMLRGLVRW